MRMFGLGRKSGWRMVDLQMSMLGLGEKHAEGGVGGEGGHMCKRGGNLAKKRKEGLFEAVFEAG